MSDIRNDTIPSLIDAQPNHLQLPSVYAEVDHTHTLGDAVSCQYILLTKRCY
jgi:hypothetical protein